MSETQNITRTLSGRVISDKRNKTRTVEVEWARSHPRYKKVVARKTNFQVHDENNTSQLGDRVEIKEGRPVSKSKSWYLVEVLEKAQ